MAIKVFIKRRFPKNKNSEKELFRCIKQIQHIVPQQPGYISGEYLKSIDEIDEITTITTWFESEGRKEIQSIIDVIPGFTAEYSVYRYIKTVYQKKIFIN